MSELSPDTQAIVNAAVEGGGGYGRATPVLHSRLSATLRAVIENCAYDDFGGHWIISADDLERIAAELETKSN